MNIKMASDNCLIAIDFKVWEEELQVTSLYKGDFSSCKFIDK